MNAWFGIPAHHEAGAVEPEAAEVAPQVVEQAEEAAEGQAPAAEAHSEAAPAAEEGHAEAAAGHDGEVPGMGGAVFFGPDNHVIDDAHHAPAWVKASPFFAMLIGALVAYWFYIVNPSLPGALARNQPVLYRFLLNKWYFDEIYDFVFVRPATWLGTFLWRGGDMGTIDGTLNGIAMGIIPWFTRLAGRAQSGYLVPLCLRHGAGAGGADALARPRERRAMNSLLSLVTFLPLIGAVVLLVFLRGEDELAQKNAKLLALFTTTATFLLSLFVLLRLRPAEPRVPVRRGAAVARRAHLQDGRRRHLGAVRDADDLPDAVDHRGELGGRQPGQGVHGRLPACSRR